MLNAINQEALAYERFLNLVSIDKSGCWIFGEKRAAYKKFYLSPEVRSISAHRFSYLTHCGVIPEDRQIDHLCCEKSCVNPDHLDLVTPRINTQRAWKKGLCTLKPLHELESLQKCATEAAAKARRSKTHCTRGHEYTPENTYIRPKGGRICRECQKHDYATKYKFKRNKQC